MADDLPTVWPAEPHTLAKHAILRRYLQAWFPILSRQSHRVRPGSQEVLFIDGFAGPGEYAGGEPGSPVIAVQEALQHPVAFSIPVRILSIEQDQDRCEHLKKVLDKYADDIAASEKVRIDDPRRGECDVVLANLLEQHEREGIRFGPALAFLDQFGYSAVSIELIGRILAYPQCEVFSYLDYRDMNRWITDPTKAAGFTRTFGGDEWTEAIPMPAQDRRRFLLRTYENTLRNRAGAKYVRSFAMFDRNGVPLYWLLFCTNHLRGLEEMKRAMWQVDKSGGYHFSDEDNPSQLPLLDDAFDQGWLAEELKNKLAGQELTAAQIKEYVLVHTPCYLFKEALQLLEKTTDTGMAVVKAHPARRRGTFPDNHLEEIVIRFPRSGLF